jgi:hypothetical protein
MSVRAIGNESSSSSALQAPRSFGAKARWQLRLDAHGSVLLEGEPGAEQDGADGENRQ